MPNYREAPDYQRLNDARMYRADLLKKSLISNPEFHQYSRAVLADVLGPLGTQARWIYSLEIGFTEVHRRNVNWEGAPDIVANNIISYASEFGYPLSVRVVEFVIKTGEEQGKPLNEPLNQSIRTSLKAVFGD